MDPMNYVVAQNKEGLPVPLRGIALFADGRRKTTDPAQEWKDDQKNALGDGVHIDKKLETPKPEKLRRELEGFMGKNPTTYGDLQEIVRMIQEHYRSNNRPMTHVYVPKQGLGSDRVVLSIIEGKVGETKVLTEADVLAKPANQRTSDEQSFAKDLAEGSWWSSWYNNPYRAADMSEEFKQRTRNLEKRVVDTEEIKAQIAGMNRSPWVRLNRPVAHPFRDVSVNFSPPGEDVLGTTDLLFKVTDQRPLKFFTGVDNSLTEVTGENRFFLGGAWYDAFLLGRNHLLGAQVFSGLQPEELLGVSLSYSIPWQDSRFDQFTELFTSYVASTVDVSLGGVPTDTIGNSFILGGRHYLELPELWGATDLAQPLAKNPYSWAEKKREALGLSHEVGAGFDFKMTDNNLEFGGSTVAESPADIAQLVLEYNARQTDPSGETNFYAKFFISPGEITNDNTDEAYQPLRYKAEAAYFYTKLLLEREQDLPFAGMMAKGILTGQYSSANLLASEQLGLGGYGSVRGYPERVLRGDLGVILNMELYSPEFEPYKWFKYSSPDLLRFIAFADYAHGESVDESPSDPLDDPADLLSVGLGIRYEFGESLRARLDYGFRLEDLPTAAGNDDDGAVHFGLIYVF